MKMKKIFAWMLALAMVFSLAACGSKTEETADGGEAAGDASEKTFKAAMILDGPIDDGGWNADCYAGLERIESELGYEVAVSESVDQADFVSAIREYAQAGYDLVILTGNQFQDACKEVYEEFPDVHFAGINFEFTDKNVSAMAFDNVQAGFLAGAFAAAISETGNVGYIGGTEIMSIVNAQKGMELGAKYINPDCNVVSSMTGSWSDAAKGKELAAAQISTSDVDVIFGFASACNTGMIEACKDAGKYYIAEPLDILDTEPGVIVGSVLTKNSELIYSIAEMVQQGVDEGQNIWGDCSNGVLEYGAFGDEVSQEVQDQLAAVIEGLSDGSIECE